MTTPYNDIEKKCLECNCPHFIAWEYWGHELHSCKLQGESEEITDSADEIQCPIRMNAK